MPHNKDKLEKCFDEGKKGGERHQGLRETKPSREAASEHLAKARLEYIYKIGLTPFKTDLLKNFLITGTGA